MPIPMMGNGIIPSLADILARVKAGTGRISEAGRERLSPALGRITGLPGSAASLGRLLDKLPPFTRHLFFLGNVQKAVDSSTRTPAHWLRGIDDANVRLGYEEAGTVESWRGGAVWPKEKLNTSPAYTNDQFSKSWAERLTDRSNLWLNAVRYEDENDMAKASILYLNDAKESLGSGSMARAALSASCAANCLAAMGGANHARRLYLEAAKMYEENAASAVKSSIRETLWSLEKAYVNYVLAHENLRAQHVRGGFISLARKANPFLDGNNALRFQIPASANGSYSGEVDGKVYTVMTDFLNLRMSNQAHPNLQEARD